MSSKKEHEVYLQVLRNIGPEKRLLKAFELSELTKQLFIHGLHKLYPDANEEEFKKMLIEKLNKCHNLNY
jgi:hypothetical protein